MTMNKLSAINLVISDEPLLVMEACDKIINQAKKTGVSEREIVDVVDKFNWDNLLASNSSLSLFSELKLTDIRFAKSPNKAAQNALIELAQQAGDDNLLLIRLPKIEKRQKSTKWFKAISQGATIQELWPPRPHEFSAWLQTRAAEMNIQLQPEACQILAEHTEGNLLAAKQSLEKLQLMYPDQMIDTDMIIATSSDNARYSVFLCLDEALSGKGGRAVKMLHKFQQESVAPISILVNLTREIELCQQTALAGLQGSSPMQALSSSYLWDSKKRLISSAVQRLPVIVWQKLLARCAYLDRMIKGQEQGDIWLELELCLWMLSGQRIWGAKKRVNTASS